MEPIIIIISFLIRSNVYWLLMVFKLHSDRYFGCLIERADPHMFAEHYTREEQAGERFMRGLAASNPRQQPEETKGPVKTRGYVSASL